MIYKNFSLQDFGELMKDSRLAPVAVVTAGDQLPFTRGQSDVAIFCLITLVT